MYVRRRTDYAVRSQARFANQIKSLSVTVRSRLALQPKDTRMSGLIKATKPTIIPVLRYWDAPAAIERLCQTFGFEKRLVVPNADGTIAHAQLSFGNGMIMLGSVIKNATEFDQLMSQPDELGGGNTQSSYVVVTDADAVYAQAKAGGAKIAMEIRNEDYGGLISVATIRKDISGASARITRSDERQNLRIDFCGAIRSWRKTQ